MEESAESTEKMQFLLDLGGGCGPRMGRLVWQSAKKGGTSAPSSLTTPLCLLYSRGGAVPNLTRDVEEEVLRGASHVTGSGESADSAVMLTMPTLYS